MIGRMDVRTFDDPATFREAARPLLQGRPAHNNLILGIVATLIDHRDVYPLFDLWLAEQDGEPAGAALRTHPYNVVISEPTDEAAIDALCDAVVKAGPGVPGVVANLPWTPRFVERWSRATGDRAKKVLAQGVYALTRVRDPRPAPGAHRPCGPEDRDLLRTWMADFGAEALSHQDPDPVRTERMLDVRLSGNHDAGLWFWDLDGEPVSLAGFAGAGEGGSRIGPVYTPPDHRGRGFASNLVAELSRWVLARGIPACFLYTDLDNPTSNGIYVDVGYEWVAESAEYSFVPNSAR
jgi:GNAT superfamily N-acetyltransferase